MADDDTAIAESALETASGAEQQQVEQAASSEGTEQDSASTEGEDEVVELDFGFEKYNVPKKLKDAVEGLRADATQKHQSASARQKELDERATAIDQQSKATEEELDARADLRRVRSQLEGAKGYDWNVYQQHRYHGLNGDPPDPMKADETWAWLQELRRQETELGGKLSEAERKRTETAQSDLTKRVQQTLEHAAKSNIKPERVSELVTFAGNIGIPDSVLRSNWSPQMLDLLHLAHIGKATLTKQATAKPATPVPDPQPLKTVTAKGSAPQGLSNRLGTEEWAKRFMDQRRQRA